MTNQYKNTSLEHLSWPEADGILKKSPVSIVPIGASSKEHGHHLPLNTDYLLAEYLTKEVCAKTGFPHLPILNYGYYPAFVEYPGSINIGKETFRDTLCDIARSLHRHEVKRIYFLNTGISTNWALEPARQRLGAEQILMEYTDLTSIISDIESQVSQQKRGTHADEIETSMLLHIAPHVVKMDLAKRDDNERMNSGKLTRDPNSKTDIFSPTGAWGDPTLATKQKGQIVVETLIDRITDFLKEFALDSYKPVPPRTKYL